MSDINEEMRERVKDDEDKTRKWGIITLLKQWISSLQCPPAQGLPRTELIRLAPVSPLRKPSPALTASSSDRNLWLGRLQGFRIWLAAWKAATPRPEPNCPAVTSVPRPPKLGTPMESPIDSISGRRSPNIVFNPERKGMSPFRNRGATRQLIYKYFLNIRDYFTSFDSQ